MRELKFRAWDIKREEIIYVNGLQFNNDGLKQVRLYRGAYQIRMAKNIVLMQYTGLKDKNEKEIYEGDIVKNDNDYIVRFDEDYLNLGFAFILEPPRGGEAIALKTIWSLEVIGNIYENPELITK